MDTSGPNRVVFAEVRSKLLKNSGISHLILREMCWRGGRTSKLLISAPSRCVNLLAVDAPREWDCSGEEAISRSHGLELFGGKSGRILTGTGIGPLIAINQLVTWLGVCLGKFLCGKDACLHSGIREENLMSIIMEQGREGNK